MTEPVSISGSFRLYELDDKGKSTELLVIGPRTLTPGDTLDLGPVEFRIPLSIGDPELPGGDQFWMTGRIAFTWEES